LSIILIISAFAVSFRLTVKDLKASGGNTFSDSAGVHPALLPQDLEPLVTWELSPRSVWTFERDAKRADCFFPDEDDDDQSNIDL
jgi:hypothetical protein